jgi:hypothetical protein
MRICCALILLFFIAGAAAEAAETLHKARHESQIEEKQLIEIEVPLTREKQEPLKEGGFTRHYEDSLFKVTDSGLFSVEIVTPSSELKVGLNTLNLIVHERLDLELTGAVVTITPWMPDMGHGVTVEPEIKEKGGGLYAAENVGFSMTGRWELRITVKKGGVEDTVVFDFPDIRKKAE